MKKTDPVNSLVTPGTPTCGFFCALLGAAIAALWLWIGFWKMLFIILFAAAGAFIGGVSDKPQAIRDLLNRRFPPKDEPVPEKETEDAAGTKEIREIVKQLKDTEKKPEDTGEE